MADIPFFASDIEILVIKWLDKHGIEYQFQSSINGGFYSLGGAVVDFIIGELAWRVMGEYYHQQVEIRSHDAIQREMLTAMGFIVIDIWGEDVLNRIDETLNKALMGEEIPHGG